MLIGVPIFVLLFLPAFPSLLVSTIAVAKNGRTLLLVPILIAVIIGGLLLSGYLSGNYRKWRARSNAARQREMAIETWRELNPDLVEEQERAASEKRIALERIRHWDAFGFLPPYEGEVVVVLSTIRTRPADWTALREVPELRQLLSQLTPTNDADLENLLHTPHLRELYLSHTGISDVGLTHLRNVPDLVLLDLRGNPAVTDKGLEHLHPLSHLQSLTLEGTGVSALGVVRLQILCPDIQAIDVPGALGYPRRQWTKRHWETARTILGEEGFLQALRDAGLDGIPADAPEEPAEIESDADVTQEALGR